MLRLVEELGRAAGSVGMIGGQVVDILSESRQVDAKTLSYIHRHKTGALFTACVRSGALLGDACPEELARLTRFAENVGLAFQITDDILDIVGDEAALGKKTGSDVQSQKVTYPALFGLTESKNKAEENLRLAVAELLPFGERAQSLLYLAKLLVHREK